MNTFDSYTFWIINHNTKTTFMTRVRIEDSESYVKIGALFCMDALLENSLRVHLSRKTSRLLKSYEIVNVAHGKRTSPDILPSPQCFYPCRCTPG